MQEMVELGRKQTQQSKTRPQSVSYVRTDLNPQQEVTMLAGPAHFGPGLKDGKKVTGNVEYANPPEACDELIEPEQLAGKIVMVARGNCMFVEKVQTINYLRSIDPLHAIDRSIDFPFILKGGNYIRRLIFRRFFIFLSRTKIIGIRYKFDIILLKH